MDGGRTRVRRLGHKQVFERRELDELLDAALVAHVAFCDDEGRPVVIPMAMARDDDDLLLHGSVASRLMRTLARGVPVCVEVTILDGLSVARSAIETSMQYRSAIVFGETTAIVDREPKLHALERLFDAMLPGRWADIRQPTKAELAQVTVVRLPLDEWSLKVSRAVPEDLPADRERPVWAGVVPIEHRFAAPRPCDELAAGLGVPDYVRAWPSGRT